MFIQNSKLIMHGAKCDKYKIKILADKKYKKELFFIYK